MIRHFFTACAMVAFLMSVAGAEILYVGWQAGGTTPYCTVSAHDLGAGTLLSPTFGNTGKPQGVAVSPLNGNVYLAIETSAFYGIKSFNTKTGEYVATVYTGSSSKKVFGIGFDSTGNLYASLSNRYIAKITPGGTINESWGNPASDTIYYTGDIMVYGDKLYGAVPYGSTTSLPGGVINYNLSNGGDASWLVKGNSPSQGSANGVAFGTDGTLYTALLNGREVREWYLDDEGKYSYDKSNVIGIVPAPAQGILDIDYYNGWLYVMGTSTVYRYDTTAAEPTWQSFVTPPTGYSGSIGYIDIAPIPEPGTLALLAAGLVGLLAYAWRRRR